MKEINSAVFKTDDAILMSQFRAVDVLSVLAIYS